MTGKGKPTKFCPTNRWGECINWSQKSSRLFCFDPKDHRQLTPIPGFTERYGGYPLPRGWWLIWDDDLIGDSTEDITLYVPLVPKDWL